MRIFLLILAVIPQFLLASMADNLEIKNGLIRLMPPTMQMTAAFMTLSNTSEN